MQWGIAIAAGTVLAAAGTAAAQDAIVVKPAEGVAAPVGEDRRVDHSAYDKLLKKHVDAQGRVDYRAWKAADRPALDRYLQSLARVDPEKLADKPERNAFWINAYNALTLKGMLHFYPTPSIKKHTSALWGFHFWDDVQLTVAGTARSLDHIEHQVLRKQSEPRIHFAIVCASVGCPRLRNEAYTGVKLATQLDAAAREFFATLKHFRIDRAAKTVRVSKILDWFRADFGETDRALLDYAARHVPDPADQAFLKRTDLTIEFLDYDWAINAQPPPDAAPAGGR